MSEIKVALRQSLPVVAGYVAVSMAFGVVAAKYIGLNSILMSATVFAGASQFVALQMIITSSSVAFIVFTTFLVNLRHVLMSSYLQNYHRNQSSLKKCLVAFGITDETFAVSTRGLREINPDEMEARGFRYQITLNMTCYLSWVLGTVAGVFIGQNLPSELVEVLPFTLTALFLYLMVVNIADKTDLIVALTAGITSLILSGVGVGWNILLATIIACFLGTRLEKKWKLSER
jgi:4-azaleucine resistance transporter AzlC